MVDHDEVPVARFPAAVDDRAGRGGVDRRAVARRRCRCLVHAAPAPAERARDGPCTGQIRPADAASTVGRRPCAWAARIRSASAALATCSASISSASARPLLESCERSVSSAAGCCEIVRARRRAHRARRASARSRAAITAVSPCTRRAERLRLRARGLHLRLRVRHLGRDPAVLHADVGQVRDLVERVMHVRARRGRRRRRGLVGLVDVDEPTVERLHRRRVLPCRNARRFVWSVKSAFSASSRRWCSARSALERLPAQGASPTRASSARIRSLC